MLPRKAQRRGRPASDYGLGAALAHRFYHGAGALRISVDHQRDAVVGLERSGVVPGGRLQQLRAGAAVGCADHDGELAVADFRQDGVEDPLVERQQQGEPTSGSQHGLDVDLAAEQSCDLPRDRQPQTGAAVFSRGGPVSLLEGLKDRPELVIRNAHAGVCDGERDHPIGAPERLTSKDAEIRQISDR